MRSEGIGLLESGQIKGQILEVIGRSTYGPRRPSSRTPSHGYQHPAKVFVSRAASDWLRPIGLGR